MDKEIDTSKINQEEYEVLKSYISEEKYIAKDRDGSIRLLTDYPERDMKREEWSDGWGKSTLKNSANNFKFIQWEHEEPYNIAELIEEYESEETEMTKDIEWLKDEILTDMRYLEGNREIQQLDIKYQTLREVAQKIHSLDEPETLSQEWIDDNSVYASFDGITEEYVHVDDLQNLLVPKQELPVIPKFVEDWIEFKKKSRIPYENVFQAIDELVKSHTSKAHSWVLKTNENKDAFARAWLDGYTVEKEQKYYVLSKDGKTILLERWASGISPCAMPITEVEEGDQLTEQEIKDYDPRYWVFRKPVEDLEEWG